MPPSGFTGADVHVLPFIFVCYRWFTNPTTVNAFYSSSTNQISKTVADGMKTFLSDVDDDGNNSDDLVFPLRIPCRRTAETFLLGAGLPEVRHPLLGSASSPKPHRSASLSFLTFHRADL